MNADSIADLLDPFIYHCIDCMGDDPETGERDESRPETVDEWKSQLANTLAAAFETELADAWDAGHGDGCIAAHCYLNRGEMWFDESKLTDCHTRNPYREASE